MLSYRPHTIAGESMTYGRARPQTHTVSEGKRYGRRLRREYARRARRCLHRFRVLLRCAPGRSARERAPVGSTRKSIASPFSPSPCRRPAPTVRAAPRLSVSPQEERPPAARSLALTAIAAKGPRTCSFAAARYRTPVAPASHTRTALRRANPLATSRRRVYEREIHADALTRDDWHVRLLECGSGGHGGTRERAGPLDEIESIWPFSRVRARAPARLRACVAVVCTTPWNPLRRSRKAKRAPVDRGLSLSRARCGPQPALLLSPLSSLFSLPPRLRSTRVVAYERARAHAESPLLLLLCLFLSLARSFVRSLFNALPPRLTPLRNVTPTSGEGAHIEHMTRQREKIEERRAAAAGTAAILRVDPLYRAGVIHTKWISIIRTLSRVRKCPYWRMIDGERPFGWFILFHKWE